MEVVDARWKNRFLNIAREAATWSKDPSTRVGAVIVDSYKNPRAIGCNGFPRGINDDSARFADRSIKNKIVQHAESNVIDNCARAGISTANCAMYVTHFPCCPCAGKIIQAGITNIIIPDIKYDDAFMARWKDDFDWAHIVLAEAGVMVERISAATYE